MYYPSTFRLLQIEDVNRRAAESVSKKLRPKAIKLSKSWSSFKTLYKMQWMSEFAPKTGSASL